MLALAGRVLAEIQARLPEEAQLNIGADHHG
jgi:hypothetical protein